ncbi:glycoside hydrolase family 27 protein [Catenulispora rubra]|uniref:glycoside hydrolase family 27 protein n=1 Tax=Catenulispora rubra TaxID=280293 RepID=UPI001892282D|nr:ricin-type beta-trefoil lectin domain protein [Catenulispora rubra]
MSPNSRPTTAQRLWRGVLAVALSLAAGPLMVFSVAAPHAQALGNNLALTPQMGFNDWNAYGCNVSESLIKSTAQAMHTDGMQAAGYQYVNIDDCWLTHNRDSSGHLVPDPAKFPDGISGTAAYVHSLGLKLGIYEDAGTMTCAGFPGSLGHEQTDANSFAAWGVDYLKYDNCYSDGVNQTSNGGPSAQSRYTTMRDALAATGRPILFSLCDWGFQNPWTWGAGVGNSWRTTGDINASFGSMLSIFHSNVGLASYAGPGAWNDPDMLEIGNGMSATEDRSEFSLWSEMAAPLISGTNVANASSTTLSTLTNSRVIAVDQDSLGKQGTEVSSSGGLDVLAKPLANGDVSVTLFNENSGTATISTSVAAIGKTGASSYTLTDLWSGATSTTTGAISASVPGHGTVMLRVAGGTSGGGGGSGAGEVHAVGAGKCLNVPNSSTTGGTQLDINACSGAANQVFTHTAGNQLAVYSGSGQMCLDANNQGTSPGTKVIIWSCNGQTNQQWLVNGNGTITGVQSGLCLDVAGAGTAAGTLVQLWTCNGQSNQQWTLS